MNIRWGANDDTTIAKDKQKFNQLFLLLLLLTVSFIVFFKYKKRW